MSKMIITGVRATNQAEDSFNELVKLTKEAPDYVPFSFHWGMLPNPLTTFEIEK